MSARTWPRALAATAILGAGLGTAPTALAASEPFIGEIMWVGFTFCPRGWAEADGQLIPIAQNTALFSLLGTTYGGNGQTTFALPDLRGRASVHVGQGAGLSNVVQGEQGGAESQTLSYAQMPAHSHTATTTVSDLEITSTLRGSSASNTTNAPAGAALGVTKKSNLAYVADAPDVDMAVGSVHSTATGGTATTTVNASESGGTPVPVRDPFLGLRACIAVEGIYPSRP